MPDTIRIIIKNQDTYIARKNKSAHNSISISNDYVDDRTIYSDKFGKVIQKMKLRKGKHIIQMKRNIFVLINIILKIKRI